jgi:hypothetical protein
LKDEKSERRGKAVLFSFSSAKCDRFFSEYAFDSADDFTYQSPALRYAVPNPLRQEGDKKAGTLLSP